MTMMIRGIDHHALLPHRALLSHLEKQSQVEHWKVWGEVWENGEVRVLHGSKHEGA